jgi:hypothetical protein
MLYGQLPETGGFVVKVPNPPKQALLRLPTSAEMIAYRDGQKTVRRSLGRGDSQSEPVVNEKADLDLFKALRVDVDGPEFDAAEARSILGKFLAIRISKCEREGDRYVITLWTPFGETKHELGIPTAKQLAQFNPVTSRDLRHGAEELKYRTQSGVDLYDGCSASSTGYAPGTEVPANHKFSVASELSQALDEPFEVEDPNLFSVQIG